jgi:hypothetical protein
MRERNIRDGSLRDTLMRRGWRWVVVYPRGARKGVIVSRHRTRQAAIRSNGGRDCDIIEIASADSY